MCRPSAAAPTERGHGGRPTPEGASNRTPSAAGRLLQCRQLENWQNLPRRSPAGTEAARTAAEAAEATAAAAARPDAKPEDAVPAEQWKDAAQMVKDTMEITDFAEEPQLDKASEVGPWTKWVASQSSVTAKSLDAALKTNDISSTDKSKVGKVRRMLWFAVGL